MATQLCPCGHAGDATRVCSEAETVSYRSRLSGPLLDRIDLHVTLSLAHGRGIGWVDAHLLASAMLSGLSIWTLDQRLDEAARRLLVAATAR